MANIVVVSGNSREAGERGRGLVSAFKRLKHDVLIVPFDGLDAARVIEFKPDLILPTSDHHIGVVGELNDRLGLAGVSAELGATLISKSKTYRALNAVGIRTPRWIVPTNLKELRQWDFYDSVFTKPDSSSGSYSPFQWEYRKFETKSDLVRVLNGCEGAFNERQCGHPVFGPTIVQEASTVPELHCVTAVMGADRVHPIAGQRVILDLPEFDFHTAISFPEPVLTDVLTALHAIGLRRQIVYVQAMMIDGCPHVIDVNVRLNLNLGSMLADFFPGMMDEIAACLLADTPISKLPDPYYVLRTIYRRDTDRPVVGLVHPPLPNNMFGIRMDASRLGVPTEPFDRQMSMPSFILFGDDPDDLIWQADAFEANTRIVTRDPDRQP